MGRVWLGEFSSHRNHFPDLVERGCIYRVESRFGEGDVRTVYAYGGDEICSTGGHSAS